MSGSFRWFFLGVGVIAAGCSSSSPQGSSVTGTAGAGTSVASTSSGSAGATASGTGGSSSSGTGGATAASGGSSGSTSGGTPGSSFATAIAVDVTSGQAVASGTLEPPDTSAMYYSFGGILGQSLSITATATPVPKPFTPGYLDTVVSLYDSQQNLIAENDDPADRSSWDALLYTVLPATGTYFIRVVDCSGWERKVACPPGPITHDGFALYLDTVADAVPALTLETAEPNDTSATAPTLATSATGSALAQGAFTGTSDVNGFVASYQANAPAGRQSMVYFLAVPAGPTGSGSTAPVASVSLSSLDGESLYYRYQPGVQQRLFVPWTFAQDNLLLLNGPAQAPGPNPFYFLVHGHTSRPISSGLNQTLETEDTLIPEPDGKTFYVTGQLQPGDFAFFDVATLAAPSTVTFACYGVQEGSGVTLEAKLLDASGTVLDGADHTESATAVAGGTHSLPAGKFSLEVVQISQDAEIIGNSYDCELVIQG